MQIYQKKRKRQEVPIIPLIDILAILLIFFIVTTTFKEKKSRLKIDLPSTTTLESSQGTDQRTAIAFDEQGQLFFGEQAVSLEDLDGQLKAFLASGRGAADLEVKADSNTPLGTLVGVWDVLTKNGLEIKDVPARIRKTK